MNENKAVTTTEEKIEFANSIDFSELFRHAEKLAGLELTFSKPEIRASDCGERVFISFRSNNIAASCGVFGKILEYCVIENFSSAVYENEDGELKYCVSVHISYQHHAGGSNGMELFIACYSNGEWNFMDVEPRQRY